MAAQDGAKINDDNKQNFALRRNSLLDDWLKSTDDASFLGISWHYCAFSVAGRLGVREFDRGCELVRYKVD